MEGMRPDIDARQIRRAIRTGSFALGALFVLAMLLASVTPYTEYLWFVHDARQPRVFDVAYGTRGALFLAAFVVAWAMLYLNLRRAMSSTLVFLSAPETQGQTMIANAIQWVQSKGKNVLWWGAPAFALFAALGFSGEWDTYLRWRNATRFGVTDPMYGLDLGFYVFTLPWWRAVSNGIFSLLFLTTALTIGLYIGLQSLSALAKIELSRPGFRLHVCALIGATLIALALQNWLRTYEAGLIDSAQFTGAGYAAMQEVGASRIFAILCGLLGLTTILTANRGKPYSVPIAGGVVLAVFFGIGVVAYPAIVQKLVVDPNRLNREAPFAERAIHMSRYAYGLESVDVRDFAVQNRPTAADLRASQTTLANMRLWDPEVLRQSLRRQQSIRPYYDFPDVDIDRYTLGGKETMVMLSPRDIALGGLDAEARNWTNERLRYTHGYGLAVSQVNAATPDGQPVFLASDIPLRSDPQVRIDQPRIYFSDYRDATGDPSDEYALVDSGEPELDFQTPTSSQTHKWTGRRGVPVGGLLARLAYSVRLADGNLLVSGNVSGSTRILIRRNVVERASKIYPFLKFDRDPYLVLLGGRMVWVLDGYTTTDMIPYSERVSAGGATLNYIRNSVKATVDAYTGEVTAYAVEPNEPILATYRRIYPGLVRDAAEIPAGLREHFRYPEDLFTLQCNALTNYHVTDPTAFLSNADAWDIASERNLSGVKAPIPPYYVELQLPDEPRSGFFQILPFTPRGRQTMSGWLAAHCDPGDYGRLTLYRFATGLPIAGPELMEGNFTATPEISNINRQFNNEQSEIVVGNLLVVPIGRSVMYAEPLYLRTKASGIQSVPRLFRVILAFNDRTVVGETYEEALSKLLGTPTEPAPTTAPSGPATGPIDRTTLRDLAKMFDQADAALRAGDFARYGELQKAARRRLGELAR